MAVLLRDFRSDKRESGQTFDNNQHRCGFDDFRNCEFCFFDDLGFSQETKNGKYFAVYSFYADRRVRARNKCRDNGFAERLLRNQPVFKQHRRSNNCVFLQLFYEKIHRLYKNERMIIRFFIQPLTLRQFSALKLNQVLFLF